LDDTIMDLESVVS